MKQILRCFPLFSDLPNISFEKTQNFTFILLTGSEEWYII